MNEYLKPNLKYILKLKELEKTNLLCGDYITMTYEDIKATFNDYRKEYEALLREQTNAYEREIEDLIGIIKKLSPAEQRS